MITTHAIRIGLPAKLHSMNANQAMHEQKSKNAAQIKSEKDDSEHTQSHTG